MTKVTLSMALDEKYLEKLEIRAQKIMREATSS